MASSKAGSVAGLLLTAVMFSFSPRTEAVDMSNQLRWVCDPDATVTWVHDTRDDWIKEADCVTGELTPWEPWPAASHSCIADYEPLPGVQTWVGYCTETVNDGGMLKAFHKVRGVLVGELDWWVCGSPGRCPDLFFPTFCDLPVGSSSSVTVRVMGGPCGGGSEPWDCVTHALTVDGTQVSAVDWVCR